MTIVLDAKVMLSGLVIGDMAPSEILQRRLPDNLRFLTSTHISQAVERALNKPCWLARNDRDVLMTQFASIGAVFLQVDPVTDVHGVAEDEEDDLVLATAVAARAEYLVAGDRFLLEIAEFRGIPIVSPREFLDRIGTEFD